MEQNTNEGFFRRFQFPLMLAAVVVILAILITMAVNSKDDKEDQNTNEQANEQTNNNSDQNQNSSNESNNENDSTTPAPAPTASSGNVSTRGTLRNSDNLARGNLMVESSSGKIYVSTKRDFAELLDKQVTLEANGTINSFTFLGFAEKPGSVAGTDTTARGGDDTVPVTESKNVSFSGELENSDNTAKGNYMVVSGTIKVYLKSLRDYSSLIDSPVTLTAAGTLNNFTSAKIVKK